MATATVEERLMAVEVDLDEIKKQLKEIKPAAKTPWWNLHFGAFKDSPYYDEAMRLGAEYRRAQPTAADDGDGDAPA
jgi:hypothetical protein